jgi:hypothetical protein
MNRRALFVSFLTLFLVLLAFNSLRAVGKPDVTAHEATFLGNAVNMHIEWQSPNPIVAVRISVGNKQQDIKVDPYDNKRNPSGYAGEVTVTIGLDWIPNQPFNYVIQLEDELRMKSELVTGKVNVPSSQQQPGIIMQPQQPGMQIQIQQNIPQPAPQTGNQPGIQPGAQLGLQPGVQLGPQPSGQPTGIIIVLIEPQNIADSGAMWRVENGPWKRSGEALAELPVGIHTIEYQNVAGWIKPENQKVMIEDQKTITINGIYKNR